MVPEPTGLPVGKELRATVTCPDGSQFSAKAFKEWLLRRSPQPAENEAYLLYGVVKQDIPDGATVEVTAI